MLLVREGGVVCIYILQDSFDRNRHEKKSSRHGDTIRSTGGNFDHNNHLQGYKKHSYYSCRSPIFISPDTVEMRMCTTSTDQVQGLCEFSARCNQPESKCTVSYCRLARLAM